MKPEGIHILAPDGTVVRANLTTRKAGRALARDLSRDGQPIMLVDPRCDYRRLYVNGYQDEDDPTGVAAMHHGAFKPVDRIARERVTLGRTHDERGMRSQRTSASSRDRDGDRSDGTDPVEALGDRSRAVPASAFRDDGPDASRCGVDGWWADETARRLIEKTLDTDASSLIYVGQTRRTLATRVLDDHLNGSIRNSTLRWSLTAILMTTPTFAAKHSDPRAVVGSPMLSDWMREHLEVAIIPVDRSELVKGRVINHYDPPLNLRGVDRTPARARLTELRCQLKLALDGRKRLPLQ